MLAFLIFIFGCTKESGSDPDEIPPVVSITSPSANQVFEGSSKVSIEATISDNTKLGEIHLEILNKATNTLYTHEHFLPTESTYHLSSSFDIPSQTSFEITIEAQDGGGNHTEATVTVSAN